LLLWILPVGHIKVKHKLLIRDVFNHRLNDGEQGGVLNLNQVR
jgi:hypothetical protein